MAGFADLLIIGQPALIGGGFEAAVTEGRTWQFRVTDVVDLDGAAVNLSTTTGVCTVWDGATSVATLTYAGATDGSFTVTLAAASTVGLANNTKGGRRCTWGLEIVSGSTQVQAWVPELSPFRIYDEDGLA